MGMTIAEKIIAAAAGVDYVKPGDIHTVTLDRMMSNDGTTHLTVDMYRNKLKHPYIADTKEDGIHCRPQCSVRLPEDSGIPEEDARLREGKQH